MNRFHRVGMLCFSWAMIGLGGCVAHAGDALTASAQVVPNAAPPGSAATLQVTLKINPPFHVNSNPASLPYLIPASVTLTAVPNVKSGKPVYPAGTPKKFAFSDQPISIYQGSVIVKVPLAIDAKAALGSVKLNGAVRYQACNDTNCFAPTTAGFSTTFTVGKTPPVLAAGTTAAAGAIATAPEMSGGAGGAGGTSIGDTRSWLGRTTDSLANSIRAAPLWLSLVFIFMGGLLMNLTPCVYPMVPITIGYFGAQGEGNRNTGFTLSLLYVLGLAIVYSALGVVAGLTGSLFGSMLQSPFVVGAIAFIFLLLSLSMLGLFTIQPPQFLMAKSGAKKGALGALAMGALLGVVAVPCIGPVVAVLVGIVATEHSWELGLLRFFVLSLGLGVPYLLLGAFAGAAKALPRSGAWLERSKKIFAIPILLVALFYGGQAWATFSAPKATADAWKLRDQYHVVGLPDVVFIDASGQERKDLRAGENLTKDEFIQKLHTLNAGASTDGGSKFAPLSADALDAATRDHQPMVLDFRADWCIPCRKLEKDVFSQSDVQEAAGGIKLLTIDLTNT